MNEESLFSAALEIEDSEARKTFLDEQCRGDQQLRRRVSQLLAGHEASNPLDRPLLATEPLRACESQHAMETAGQWVGPYKLLEQIGEGGFGLVFVAEQEKPVRRRVALKVIKPGMDSKQVVARFEAERQALAMMEHVNIAKVFDAGTTASGRPYFVMELVHGLPITTFCDENRLTPRERLELLIPVCQAIQHAHHKGIIHRDIKPSNVLVTLYDDRPVPKVIDFGVAKAIEQRLTEKTVYTQYGTMVGTFEYVSPEQAEMNAFGVDTRSDVYSLGVLLYELLTGTTPLDRASLREAAYGEIIRMIKEVEPVRPSMRLSKSETLAKVAASRRTEPANLASLVHGELDWIVMRCLEKDRTRRYETAIALAADLRHFLADEPVAACPPMLSYRLRKFYRRNRPAVLTATAFVAVLLLATVTSVAMAVRANRSEHLAQLQRTQAEESARQANLYLDQANIARENLDEADYARSMSLAYFEWEIDNVGAARHLLNEAKEELRGWEWRYLSQLCNEESLTLNEHEIVSYAMFNSDGSRIVTATISGDVKVLDARSGKSLWEFDGHPEWQWSGRAIFSPDDRFIAVTCSPLSGSERKKTFADNTVFDVVILNAETGEKIRSLPSGPYIRTAVRATAFSPDGSRLVVGTDMDLPHLIYDARTGEKLLELEPNGSAALSFAFSPDGSRIVAGNLTKNSATMWNAVTGVIVMELKGQPWELFGQPWDFKGHTGNVQDAVYSPDGETIFTASADRTIRIWDAKSGEEKRPALTGHRNMVRSLAVSPDGHYLASGSGDTTIKIWSLDPMELIRELKGHTGNQAMVSSVDFHPSATHIITSSWDKSVALWPVQPNHTTEFLASRFDADFFWPMGDAVLVWDREQNLSLRDARTGQLRKSFGPVPVPSGYREWIAIHPSEKRFAIVHRVPAADEAKDEPSPKYKCDIWHAQTGEQFTFEVPVAVTRLDYSRDGNCLILATIAGKVEGYDANTGDPLPGFKAPQNFDFPSVLVDLGIDKRTRFRPSPFRLSVDGSRLVTGGEKLFLWDATTKEQLREFVGHRSRVESVSLSPDGTRLVSSSDDGTVRLWDTFNGHCLLTIELPDVAIDVRNGEVKVSFSADGSRIAMHNRAWMRILDARPSDE